MAETKRNNKYLKYHIIALFTVIVWGTTFISTKVLINQSLSPTEIFFYRFLLAYISIWFFSPRIIWSKSYKDEFLFFLLGLCGGSLYFITENTALGITLASNVSLILCTTPVLTAFLSSLIFKKDRLTRNLVYGSLVAIIGVVLVVFNGNFILKINPLGDFLTILAAFSWAFYSLILKRLESHYSTLYITRKVFFYGVLTLVPLLYFEPISFKTEILFHPVVLLNVLFLGLVASLLCFFTWNLAVKELGVVRATNYIYVIPLVTLITSAVVLDEKITLIAALGSVCILLGVYVAENGMKIRKPKKHFT
ncbi:MAG: DMT family transporter [Flavobacteriaceae bacterium]|jgi:drug/metabolite transporter (DMT)-like permease|nr:DMT family transporter [Flavobacteriaceae bacterium]